MKASDLTSQAAVLEAMAEADRLGRVAFLNEHGYDVARWLYVEHDERLYDSKAIVGVALGRQYGDNYVRDRDGYTGGEDTVVPALRRLGFNIVDSRRSDVTGRIAPKLRPRQVYSWDELGELFGCSPDYFAVGGGMLALRALNVLLIVTHPGGAKSFDYDDHWDNGELVYTGKGLSGDQKYRAENRDAAENRRTNYVFEYAGSKRLRFLGIGRCVDWHPDVAPGQNGAMRKIFRFRLAFDDPGVAAAAGGNRVVRSGVTRASPDGAGQPGKPPARAAVRRPRAFDPGRPPASYRRAAAGSGRTQEETNALREKANAAHHSILVRLATELEAAGWSDIEEIPAAIDLRATNPSGQRVLFEAKSLTDRNESGQVRGGLAQLLEYRFLYGETSDALCLVTNGQIRNARARLLRALGIDAIWSDSALHAPSKLLDSELGAVCATVTR